MNTKQSIFLVEDDSNIRELVVYTLNNSGYRAVGFGESTSFWEAVKSDKPDLILLDIMLPGEDGLQILKRIRGNTELKTLPIMMLTAKTAEYDKVVGLDGGADDYMGKPFGMMELMSRVRALLRRTGGAEQSAKFAVGPLIIDTEKYTVSVGGNPIALTLKEFELLKMLMENRGVVLTRDRILVNIWGYDFDGETRTVDVHIRTLRTKLGEVGELVETVRGIGYRISEA